MKQVPCEYIIWKGLPIIRNKLAETLINEFGLNQREAAEKLGLTPAAICQYHSKKRGQTEITSESFLQEIHLAAERIIKHHDAVIPETCRICRLIQSKKELTNIILSTKE